MNDAYVHFLHQGVHSATDDPEDTVTIALTQAELTSVCLGGHLVLALFPCLTPVIDRLTIKVIELIEAQRPDWPESEYWGDHGKE